MTSDLLEPMLAGMSVYQDVVLAGRVLRRGVRDCEERWSLIEPHLPRSGAVLDVGSNFGWFALRTALSRPRTIVVSAEADARAAQVQRVVLQSHEVDRVVLITRRAGAKLARQFADRQQRFAAVYCLSVLHWMPDHREFLQAIAASADRIFLEFPGPCERDVGLQRVRDEIGDFGAYLRELFPAQELQNLGAVSGLPVDEQPRSIWLIAANTAADSSATSTRADVATLLANAPAWPTRPWWCAQMDRLISEAQVASPTPVGGDLAAQRVWMTPEGLFCANSTSRRARSELQRIRRRLSAVPEETLFTATERVRRRTKHLGSRVRHGLEAFARAINFST